MKNKGTLSADRSVLIDQIESTRFEFLATVRSAPPSASVEAYAAHIDWAAQKLIDTLIDEGKPS